jgi:hypothetical protein
MVFVEAVLFWADGCVRMPSLGKGGELMDPRSETRPGQEKYPERGSPVTATLVCLFLCFIWAPIALKASDPGKAKAEALVKQSWVAIQKAQSEAETQSPSGPPGGVMGWSYVITPPFPCKWPPDGQGEVCYYAYARGLRPGLMDAEVVSTLWGCVVLDATRKKPPRMDILSRELGEGDIQGVRPLMPQEMAIYRTAETAEAAIRDLAKATQPKTAQARAIRRYYCQWSRDNGVASGQVRVFHEGFFRWLDCSGAQSRTK